MKQKIIITYLMPAYNEERSPLLEKTIKSVVDQGINNCELLVVDDCSSDQTSKEIKKIFRKLKKPQISLKIIKNTRNLGVAGTLNEGINIAKGKYISRIDVGDIMHPLRSKKQLKYLNSNHDIYLLGTYSKQRHYRNNSFNETNFSNPNDPYSFPDIKKKCLYHNYLVHVSWMVKKELFKKIGKYDPKYALEDYELCIRAIVKGYKVAQLAEYLTTFSWTGNDRISANSKNNFQIDRLKIRVRFLPHLFTFYNTVGTIKSIIGATGVLVLNPRYFSYFFEGRKLSHI